MAGFGDLEAAIMDRVWATDAPVRVRQVVEDLRREREIAYTTVQTVMDILHRKGWLTREKRGRAHFYWAAASREDYTATLVDQALATAPDRTAALARLIEQLPPAEVAEVRRTLDRVRSETGEAQDAKR